MEENVCCEKLLFNQHTETYNSYSVTREIITTHIGIQIDKETDITMTC